MLCLGEVQGCAFGGQRKEKAHLTELNDRRLSVETKSSSKMSKKSMAYLQCTDRIGWFPWPFKRI